MQGSRRQSRREIRFCGRGRDLRAGRAIPSGIAWQRRVGVDPAAFQGDPVRAKISFFEYVGTNPLARRQGDGGAVDGSHVAKQDHISGRCRNECFVQESWQVFEWLLE